jgi:hypothetical protein
MNPCPACDGTGKWYAGRISYPCGECGGTGVDRATVSDPFSFPSWVGYLFVATAIGIGLIVMAPLILYTAPIWGPFLLWARWQGRSSHGTRRSHPR